MFRKVEVFDFDGVVVCSQHRYRLGDNGKIDLRHWRENEHKAKHDRLLPHASMLRDAIKRPDVLAVIATARVLDDHTIEYLSRHDLMPDALVGRASSGDSRKGAELKSAGIMEVFRARNVSCETRIRVYEDNMTYLWGIVSGLKAKGYTNTVGHFIKSNQGF